jgi:3-deoxy-D-manno-octulosonate 8-phosphate phosphatase (KDO 8-P phosphatase)
MSKINYDLTLLKAFLFDVDGVLSSDCISMSMDGEPMRTANIKDGYAMQLAVKCGYVVGIITGANTENIRIRYNRLGINHIYLSSRNKITDYEDFLKITGLSDNRIAYVGDDIPDYEVMKRVGLSVAPSSAAPEIKNMAKYISPYTGGNGVARDLIEQTLKAQGHWMNSDAAFGW